MQFPDIYVSEAEKENLNKNWYKQFLNAAIDYFITEKKIIEKRQKQYDSYNGIQSAVIPSYLENIYGKPGKVKYIDYKLGRTKIKLVIGEFLTMPLASTVSTINKEAVNEKLNKQVTMLGMMAAKPQLEEAKQAGLNPFDGVVIPDASEKQDVFKSLNIKTQNEVLMQIILNQKLVKDRLKMKLNSNFTDLAITSSCFGKVERSPNGVDTYRPIEVNNAIFVDSSQDPFLKRSPFIGERRLLFKHEIFSMFPDLTNEEKGKVTKMTDSPSEYKTLEYVSLNGINAIGVYFLEWKAFKADIRKFDNRKEIPIIYESDEKDYEKGMKKKEEGFSYDKKYRQAIYQGIRIGYDIYPLAYMKEKEWTVQTRNGGDKYEAEYDYKACSFGMVSGVKVSLQDVISDLSDIYNIIRFQINRELSKMKGKAVTYNRAYLPKDKKPQDIWRELIEESYLEYDTSEDGNTDPQHNAVTAIKEIDFGGSQSLPVLLNLGVDVERLMDTLTGINASRSGQNKASATATGVNMDLNASRSTTFDLFYFMELFSSEVMKHLCEKTKINWTFLKESLPGLLLSTSEEEFMEKIHAFAFDDFDVHIIDGRKEMEIRERARALFPSEINAGKLRAMDTIKFEQSETLGEAVEFLGRAWKEIESVAQMQTQKQIEANRQQQKATIDAQIADREDRQQHELDAIKLKGEIDNRNILTKAKATAGIKDIEGTNKQVMQNQEQQHEKEMADQEQMIGDDQFSMV